MALVHTNLIMLGADKKTRLPWEAGWKELLSAVVNGAHLFTTQSVSNPETETRLYVKKVHWDQNNSDETMSKDVDGCVRLKDKNP